MSIDLNFSVEQTQVVDSVHRALADLFPVSRLRARPDAAPDTARLQRLAELGAFGMAAPEAAGGTGFSVLEEALLAVEMGRFLLTPCALATPVAARLALALGQPGLAAELIAGSQWACLAVPLASSARDPQEVHLFDAEGASVALLWDDDGIALLRRGDIRAERVAATDRSVTLARGMASAQARIGWIGASDSTLVSEATLLVGASLLGMAQATRDMAVAYAKERVQFGQPIGAFQAVKHRCVNMALAVESLRAQTLFAAIALRDGWADAGAQLDACRWLAAPCALANARDNIQVHGAMGFTAECDAHLYLLRAHLYQTVLAPTQGLRQRLATHRSLWAGARPPQHRETA
jgi:alkylation response protein AidB-like acyl-CoA dehydrogenase